eukprot:TRINITY_DN93664_c0_g1_i1.p2 TRINITY_DN93664_c0_g1~~TRINITY_DN93664_c0_g1_i1.p2  ORF type:complete len:130 (+),score=9.35 TRINITY_DN93664_c0_g1_i1:492-881(+)
MSKSKPSIQWPPYGQRHIGGGRLGEDHDEQRTLEMLRALCDHYKIKDKAGECDAGTVERLTWVANKLNQVRRFYRRGNVDLSVPWTWRLVNQFRLSVHTKDPRVSKNRPVLQSWGRTLAAEAPVNTSGI